MPAEPHEAEAGLAPMPLGEQVIHEFRTLRLSLKAHPLAFLREGVTGEGRIANAALETVAKGARVSLAGLVLVRQRPGTAKGVIFATLEDETGIANIIVWPKTFERFRRVVLGSRLIGVTGRVQRQGLVIHVVATRLEDLSARLDTLSEDHGMAAPLANADEVVRGAGDPREITLRRHHADEARARAILPKGRHFH